MVASLYQIPRPLATAPGKKPKILIAFGRDLLYTLGKQCRKASFAHTPDGPHAGGFGPVA